MKLLLISNSTNPGQPYLDYTKPQIADFLGTEPVDALFIPYAAVRFSFDQYEEKVQKVFQTLGHSVHSIHKEADPMAAVKNAKAIVVGGGNTWQLVHLLHKNKLMDAIRERGLEGVPYIGWSAGSNIACPTLKTTNDMPIIDPISFKTLNLVPFQINPHYLDAHPENHGGETREERILEFLVVNPETFVVGLREATMLRIEDKKIELIGERTARIFKANTETRELKSTDTFEFLIQ